MDYKSESGIVDMIERIPIVYTTKLEEMDIFMTSIADMNLDSVIDSIIKESKPEFNLKRKRKLQPSHHFTYEDLSSCINALNRKMARKAEISENDPSRLCKPVSVVLQDLKYLLRPAPQSSESKQTLNENVQKANLMDWYKPTIKTRPYTSQKSKIIYDAQSKEYDLYSFDNESSIKQYTRIQANNSNSKLFLTFKEDKPFLKVMCCCWYNREWYVKSQTKHHRTSIKFMRKQHRCTADLCHCCCRTKEPVSQNTSLKEVTIVNTNTQIYGAGSHKIQEAPNIWFNRVTGRNSIAERIPSTSLTEMPGVNQTNNFVEEELSILHTTNIKFGDEFYEIGAEGQLKLFYKRIGNDSRPFIMPPSANNIIDGNICCWYKREKFAVRLLELGALPNFVNFLRFPHPCSVTNCICCCKPIKHHSTILVILPVTIRHTNNLAHTHNSKKVNSTIKPVKTLNTKPVSNVSPTTDATASFYISMAAMNILANTTDTALTRDVLNEIIPESDVLDKKSLVRFIIDKSGPKCKIVVEGVDLNSITTKELRMLDILFSIIKNSLLKDRRPTTVIPKPRNIKKTNKSTAVELPAVGLSNIGLCKINPTLYLNEKVSLMMDLRYKRFLPSLRDHLKMFELPNIKDISEWFDGVSSTADTRNRVKSSNEICKPSLLHQVLAPKP